MEQNKLSEIFKLEPEEFETDMCLLTLQLVFKLCIRFSKKYVFGIPRSVKQNKIV